MQQENLPYKVVGISISLLLHALLLFLLALILRRLMPPGGEIVFITLGDGSSSGDAPLSASSASSESATAPSTPIDSELLDRALKAITKVNAQNTAENDGHSQTGDSSTRSGNGLYEWRNAKGRQTGIGEYGGSPASENSVELGLTWLLRHQDEDGKWSADSFDRHCRSRGYCKGAGAARHTAGVTGLAFLCFLAAGYTPDQGPYTRELQSTQKYLLSSQNSLGFFGDEEMFNHAIVLLALTELYAQTDDKKIRQKLKEAIERGIEATILAQRPEGGWDYRASLGDSLSRNDTSITGWQLMSLISAKRLGFSVPEDVLERGFKHIKRCTLPSGEVRYADVGPNASRKSDALVAVALLCALLYGEADEIQKKQLQILVAYPPRWEVVHTLDHCMYYWYHGTLALFLVGGEPWEKWNTHLSNTLLERQVKTGEAAGSWPPEGQWGGAAGRVYSTAINILNLEIYYRYRPSFMYSLTQEQIEYLKSAQK